MKVRTRKAVVSKLEELHAILYEEFESVHAEYKESYEELHNLSQDDFYSKLGGELADEVLKYGTESENLYKKITEIENWIGEYSW